MTAFSLSYALQELRHRKLRLSLVALGLASGVGLVVTVSSVSAGFDRTEEKVLSPLRSLGTDVLVTQPAPTADGADKQALADANRGLVTDLAGLGKPGQRFTHDFFLLASSLPLEADTQARLEALPHVASATPALAVLATHQTGVVPKMVASLTAGGQTVSQLQKPAPLTQAEAQHVRSCIVAGQGVNDLTSIATKGPSSAASDSLSTQVESCLPHRFREYVATVTVPLQTVKQVLAPPQTDIRSSPYTLAGVDPAQPTGGPVTTSQLVAGRFLSVGSPDEALVDSGYAAARHLGIGSVLPINARNLRVVGLTGPSPTGQSANLYVPLTTAQQLTGHPGAANVLVVHADSAADVKAVASEIKKALPGAHVTTAAAVADQVKSSLSGVRRLTHRAGLVLEILVLTGAFAIATLLTLGNVAKRVREIGTLRAMGWSRRRTVGQLVLESVGVGVVGAVAGCLLGVGIANLVTHVAPPVTAHGPKVESGSKALADATGVKLPKAERLTTQLRLATDVTAPVLAEGAALALLGALMAGGIGGWRASRLAPVVALRDLG